MHDFQEKCQTVFNTMLCLPLFCSKKCIRNKNIRCAFFLACERSGGGAGKGRTACWNLNICIEKVEGRGGALGRCEMLIGRDDISNDVITLGTYFSRFVYIRVRFRFTLIGGILTATSTGATGNWRWNSTFRGVVEGSPPFPALRQSARRACSQAPFCCIWKNRLHSYLL